MLEDGGLGPAVDSKLNHRLGGFAEELADRQAGPHAHQIRLDPTGKWAVVMDLGTDVVYAYRFDDRTGCLSGSATSAHHLVLPVGAGPRHLDFSPDGKFAYVKDQQSPMRTFDFEQSHMSSTGLSDSL